MEVLQIFGFVGSRIDMWFANHQPLIPTLLYICTWSQLPVVDEANLTDNGYSINIKALCY